MYIVDRSAAVLKPRQPFLDWLTHLPDNDIELSLDEIRSDCTVVMIPEVTEPEDGIAHIDDIADKEDVFRTVAAHEIEQAIRLAGARSQMDVGKKD